MAYGCFVMLHTPLCDLLGIELPILQAGMGGVARAELCAAVSNAGGLGHLGMIRMPPEFIRAQIRRARSLTDRPFGVNLVLAVFDPAQFEVCLEERVPVLSLFWGDAAPYVPRARAAGIRVLVQVGSVEEARQAVRAGADAVVAQGVEAGGHVRGRTSTLALIPQVVDAVRPTPVVAAGGIADGRGIAAALNLGAAGVWVGTRFVASAESEAHPAYKQRLLAATAEDTVHTELCEYGWPPHSPHRVLRTPLLERWGHRPPPPVEQARVIGETDRAGLRVPVTEFSSGCPTIHTTGEVENMALYAGQGVGLIRELLPAAEIVRRLAAEAEALLRPRP